MIKVRQFERGEVIFRENEIGETAYLIEHGRVEVLKNLDGRSVHIAFIGPRQPFGEMGMIDEKPRSATVVAVERTVVHELHRDDFLQNLHTHPEFAVSLLKVLFERLRETDAELLRLTRQQESALPVAAARIPIPAYSPAGLIIAMEGLTPKAIEVLPDRHFQITTFPFRIGRQCSDKLVHNDLSLADVEPLQISRHHIAIFKEGDRIGITDRGSRLGFTVDGVQFGGPGRPNTFLFNRPDVTLVLGNDQTRFKYRLSIRPTG